MARLIGRRHSRVGDQPNGGWSDEARATLDPRRVHSCVGVLPPGGKRCGRGKSAARDWRGRRSCVGVLPPGGKRCGGSKSAARDWRGRRSCVRGVPPCGELTGRGRNGVAGWRTPFLCCRAGNLGRREVRKSRNTPQGCVGLRVRLPASLQHSPLRPSLNHEGPQRYAEGNCHQCQSPQADRDRCALLQHPESDGHNNPHDGHSCPRDDRGPR